MPLVRSGNGKLFTIGGKLSGGGDCTCPLPAGDCTLSACFELKLDDSDTTDQDFFDCGSMGVYFDGTNWQVYALGTASLIATDPRNTWQKFVFQFSQQDDETILATWTVNGVSGPNFQLSPSVIESVQFGAQFPGTGGAKHRLIRNISLNSVRITGFTFQFPPDDFDSLTGSGISIDGNGDLRIDSDEAMEDDYGSKAAHADPTCCTCPAAPGFRDCAEISGFSLKYDFSAHSDAVDEDCAAFDVSGSHTFNFTRVDRADLINDSSLTFACFNQKPVDSHCELNFTSFHFDPVAVRWDFPIDGGVCTLILDPIFLSGNLHPDPDDECGGGTLDMGFDSANAVTSERCRCASVDEEENVTYTDCATCEPGGEPCPDAIADRCGGALCGIPAGAFQSLGSWMPGDASGIKGTYTATNTCTTPSDPHGSSMTLTVTLTVF